MDVPVTIVTVQREAVRKRHSPDCLSVKFSEKKLKHVKQFYVRSQVLDTLLRFMRGLILSVEKQLVCKMNISVCKWIFNFN